MHKSPIRERYFCPLSPFSTGEKKGEEFSLEANNMRGR